MEFVKVFLEDDKRTMLVPYNMRNKILIVPVWQDILPTHMLPEEHHHKAIRTKDYRLEQVDEENYIGRRCDF